MRIVGVVSHGNGAGKTRLLEGVLHEWPGRFGVVKFTTVYRDGRFCPKDAQRRCACSRLHDRYELVTDAGVLEQADTDTGRLSRAGARPVLWCLARPDSHAEAWAHARDLLPADGELLTEGNTAMTVVPADALIFVVNPAMPRRFWKDNWRELAARASAVVVNECPQALGRRPPAPEDDRRAALFEVMSVAANAESVEARLAEPLAAWATPGLRTIFAGA